MSSPSVAINQARNAEQTRKSILTKIHRVIDAYEDGRGATSCMSEIQKIIGRKQ